MVATSRSVLVTGIHTLTPTHCGTGQAAGAIDLPIAREAHTGLPLLPATSLKGIARDEWFRLPGDEAAWSNEERKLYEEVVRPLFGPLPPRRRRKDSEGAHEARAAGPPEPASGQAGDVLAAGDLVFLDGLLLAFPVRSLTGGFRLVTSPLLLHRLRRLVQSLGSNLAPGFVCPEPNPDEALLPPPEGGPLSLEDVVFSAERCRPEPEVKTFAESLGRLVARSRDDADRVALAKRLVVVGDEVLQDLTQRATPVAARIVLSETKTSENLWYEEALPPDCLFAAVIAARPGSSGDPVGRLSGWFREDGEGATAASSTSRRSGDDGGGALRLGYERCTQIGGNATVGYGQCRWVLQTEPEVLA